MGEGAFERIDDKFLSPLSQLTLPQILARQAERWGSKGTAIRQKAYGIWQAYTWEDYLRDTKQVALGLLALGLRRGENIGIILDNHPEWLFSELGGQAVGGIPVNLFTSSMAQELAAILQRIQAAYVIVQNQEQVDKLLDMKQELPDVRRVIYVSSTGMRSYAGHPWLSSFRELLDLGAETDRREPDRFEEELRKGCPQEVALMLMTSGTTGLPKLALFSHQAFAEMARTWMEAAPVGVGDNWISITPTAWIVEQMWGFGVALASGMTMNFPETPETVMEDLREIGPEVLITSSAFWEDLASKIRVKIDDSGWVKRTLFALSERIGDAVVERKSKRESVPFFLKGLHGLASWVICRPLLDQVGCTHIRAAITGGHPISPEVVCFFQSKGLNLKHAYGITEAGGVFQVQPKGEVKPETVGKPLPRITVKIGEGQEILVSSPSNFLGYFQDPEATRKALSDGWLHTGDVGAIDDEGYLLILGRKEEIICTREGEAFSPDSIETRLRFSPYIKEAVIFGEGRDYVTAMINIDLGNVGSWAQDRMIPYTTYADLSQQEAVEELILGEVRQINARLPEAMKVRKMILLNKLLDADDGELTRTGKVRRRFIYDQYRSLIESMYSSDKELAVTGKIRYRDGQVSTLETKVKVLSVG